MTNNALQVFTLGQLQIQENRLVLDDFISSKAIVLFAYLAMHPGEHHRKKLAVMLWSETQDEQALKNLRTVLSSLRQKLPDALIVERDTLAINPERGVHVDALTFEDEVTELLAAPGTPEALYRMQALAKLYQGHFLETVTVRDADTLDEWISGVQRHLQQLYTRLMYEIVRQAEEQADYETGLAYARRLAALDPYWDAARRHLMRMLTYTNRSNEALREYEAFAALLLDELDTEPEAETSALYEQIRTRNIRLPGQRVTQTLIALPDMPFVESPDDIALVQRMLNTPQCRLLTLYGITGVGKTTLATQMAFHRQHLYRDGAYLVMVKAAQTVRDLAYQLARVLHIEIGSQQSPSEIEAAIVDTLKDRHLLLVLDNYEHLLPETAFLQRILEHAPRVQVLVTSQAPLNLFREWLLPLQGLRVPPPDTPNPEDYEAVRLFELTAQRINPRFNVKEHLAEIVEICRLVDGLPLALIIAAGWTQVVPVRKIKDYILEGQEFSLPLHQDLPPHHQSLDLMLDHTWNALTTDEQHALTTMSIFNAAAGLDEIEQVCAIRLDVLMAMIQKSLIQKFDEKYRMHPLIWRYARRKLLFSDQREVLWERYTASILQMLRELQAEKLPLHETLLSIEYQYEVIWNYEWMPKAVQPAYILEVSRFLMAYWEISRGDQHAALRALFEGMNRTALPQEARLLLNVQLARFALLAEQWERAYGYLQEGLRENAVLAPYEDWSAAFNLGTALLTTIETGALSMSHTDEDIHIRVTMFQKLLALYLNMRDYDAAEGFFVQLLQDLQQPLYSALLLATWGMVNAERGQSSEAYEHLSGALHDLEALDQPLLKLNVQMLALRIAFVLERRDLACGHLAAIKRLNPDVNALQQVVRLCADHALISVGWDPEDGPADLTLLDRLMARAAC